MTDPGWGDLIGNTVLAAIVVITGLRGRKKQNDKMVSQLDDAIGSRVAALEQCVVGLKSDREHEKVERAIMTAHIKHLDHTMTEVAKDVASLEDSIPKVQGVVADVRELVNKTMNFFERNRANALEEKALAGSGGLTALKKKEGK